MAQPSQVSRQVRFGEFQLDLQTAELRNNGHKQTLQDHPFQVLILLLDRPGQLVTRDDLKKELWASDTFVDFDQGLNKAVNRLREALHDSAEKPRFIETLPRKGYRFIAAVETSTGHPANGQTIDAPQTAVPVPARANRLKLVAGVLGIALILCVAGWLARGMGSGRPVTAIRSIAVLPLENLSGDANQDYFADAMTDELITHLGQIGSLHVISRTSIMQYKGVRKPLPQIARELNVDAVIEGTVLRSGDRVRITAQLIEASSDKHLWAHAYERDLRDILGLQNAVAADIAEETRLQLTPRERAVLKSTRVAKPSAYEAYFRGRHYWDARSPEGITRAIDSFSEAIRDDPDFALPYARLAQVYAALPDYMAIPPREAYGKAEVAARKALELDDNLAEAHTALGGILLTNDYDWSASEREFRRAIEINPGYADAYHWHAINLMFMGRWEEAITEIEHARQLDPLSIIINANSGFILFHGRRFDEAVAEEQKALILDPNSPVAHEYLGLAYIGKKMDKDAVAELHRAVALSGEASQDVAELSFAYAAGGDLAQARKILVRMKQRSRNEYVPSFSLAVAYTGLGDKNAALTYLERAYEERCDLVPTIKTSPLFDSLHSSPRFQELLRQIGFPS